ncbi:MAG: GTPase ObgE [Candidatus Staskawiczbacteria bacterium]|nr:GTPase ObgE [Candidatus Staskawiczbacteria bacterium]
MIIDDVKINITAGHGGRGLVVFSKTKMTLGPTGGSGGNGGNIFLQGVSDLGALRQFRFKKDIKAQDGENGRNQLHDGHDAEDLILLVPVGTVSHNITTGKSIEITKIGQLELIAKGGRGGRGNYLFRSATNTSPKQFEEDRNGESFELRLELKMIADVGFIGLPNVGKSSLLNELTNANSKVANYPFTTLNPNLGVYYDLILADIPGLVEGASAGKGLGIKFLRHIERTKVLFHFISADSANPVGDYKTVRTELTKYNELLLEKPEYIFLSRSDMVLPEISSKIIKDFKKIKKEIIPISIIDFDSIKHVKEILGKLMAEKTA